MGQPVIPKLNDTVGVKGKNTFFDVFLVWVLVNNRIRWNGLAGYIQVSPGVLLPHASIFPLMKPLRDFVVAKHLLPASTKAETLLLDSKKRSAKTLLEALVKDNPLSDQRWNQYDSAIKDAVNRFNARLSATKGFHTLDWRWVKAMQWTEVRGPDAPGWNSRPMQIGNPGDPGLGVLRDKKDHSELVVDDQLRQRLQGIQAGGKWDPKFNIEAGVAFLFHKAAIVEDVLVIDNPASLTYAVKANDTFDSLAKTLGTTVDVLKSDNPKVNPGALQINQKLNYRKSHHRFQITGWRSWDDATQRYNVGNPDYLKTVRAFYKKIVVFFP